MKLVGITAANQSAQRAAWQEPAPRRGSPSRPKVPHLGWTRGFEVGARLETEADARAVAPCRDGYVKGIAG